MPHIHEKIDFTVEVFIVEGDAVLLRKHDKYGIWLSVGGHVELDEDPVQAAIREVKEEVGLEVELSRHLLVPTEETETYKELIPPVFMNRHRINPTHEHVCLTYFARATSREVSNQESEKSSGLGWFNLGELQNLEGLTHAVKVYAEAALTTLAS